ncbi:MAG TPA: Maf family protein [Jiangellaceae bacterium]
MIRLLLASASPGRLATLRRAGVEPLVQASGVDEDLVLTTVTDTVAPAEAALLLARAKAEAVAAMADDAVVVGCDSVLELDGAAHGKPRDAAQATARWRAMRGRSGVLHSGHWVIDRRAAGRGGAAGAVASTTVHFAEVTDDEINAYVATGEPLHVAGGFTIDGLGGAFVDGVEGDHHNVVGLSLPLLRRLLGDLGVRWTDLWS